jgi:hypothetical protein
MFIYCNWVSTRWQPTVNLYKNKKETPIYTKGETMHKTIKNTEYTKQKSNIKNKKTNIETILKNISQVIRR